MPWVYIICFALIAAGLLTLFGVRPGDFIDALFRSQRKSATLTDELNVLMGTPAKGFFNQDFELKQIGLFVTTSMLIQLFAVWNMSSALPIITSCPNGLRKDWRNTKRSAPRRKKRGVKPDEL